MIQLFDIEDTAGYPLCSVGCRLFSPFFCPGCTEVFIHQRLQIRDDHRLGQVIGKACFEQPLPVPGRGACSKGDDRSSCGLLRVKLLKLQERIYAVKLRHTVIKENHIVIIFTEPAYAFLSSGGGFYHHFAAFQQTCDHLQVHGHVVDYKYPFSRRGKYPFLGILIP